VACALLSPAGRIEYRSGHGVYIRGAAQQAGGFFDVEQLKMAIVEMLRESKGKESVRPMLGPKENSIDSSQGGLHRYKKLLVSENISKNKKTVEKAVRHRVVTDYSAGNIRQ
jgi:hypothetical protein